MTTPPKSRSDLLRLPAERVTHALPSGLQCPGRESHSSCVRTLTQSLAPGLDAKKCVKGAKGPGCLVPKPVVQDSARSPCQEPGAASAQGTEGAPFGVASVLCQVPEVPSGEERRRGGRHGAAQRACSATSSCTGHARGNRHVSAFEQPSLLGETHRSNTNMHRRGAGAGTLGAASSPRPWGGRTEEPRFSAEL